MIRILILFSSVMLFASFVIPGPVEGRWISCEQIRIGDDRIVMKKWSYPPCTADNSDRTEMTFYTEMTFDTTGRKRLLVCSGSASLLVGAAVCHYSEWTYNAASSTLMIKSDTLVVEYLVNTSDSTLILTKVAPSIR